MKICCKSARDGLGARGGAREVGSASLFSCPSPQGLERPKGDGWTVKRREVENGREHVPRVIPRDSHPSYPSSMTSVCAWGMSKSMTSHASSWIWVSRLIRRRSPRTPLAALIPRPATGSVESNAQAIGKTSTGERERQMIIYPPDSFARCLQY